MSRRNDLEAEIGMAEYRWEEAKKSLQWAQIEEGRAYADYMEARHDLIKHLQSLARMTG